LQQDVEALLGKGHSVQVRPGKSSPVRSPDQDRPARLVDKRHIVVGEQGFAIMYGGMEAMLASQQASTGVSPDEHLATQVAAMVRAAATGQFPNLAAALTAAEPSRVRDADEVFDSCVHQLIDGALPG
jgi:Tetracyclin repressor-like, C-terminal domain